MGARDGQQEVERERGNMGGDTHTHTRGGEREREELLDKEERGRENCGNQEVLNRRTEE